MRFLADEDAKGASDELDQLTQSYNATEAGLRKALDDYEEVSKAKRDRDLRGEKNKLEQEVEAKQSYQQSLLNSRELKSALVIAKRDAEESENRAEEVLRQTKEDAKIAKKAAKELREKASHSNADSRHYNANCRHSNADSRHSNAD